MEAGSVVFEKYRSTRSVRVRIVFSLLRESASTMEIHTRLILKTGGYLNYLCSQFESFFLILENCFFFALIDLKLLKRVEFSKT